MPIAGRREFRLLCAGGAFITATLLVYSQTLSLTWDEGFHLLAAQLINAGKRPYLDFLFAQTPLNAYWNALWMRVFGESWHLAHALAALESAGAAMLAAGYVFQRFPAAKWRLAAAFATAILTGLNVAVVEYGTLGQAYGLCLLLIVAAFRFTVASVERRSPMLAGLAGLASGAAAGSSLLTATVAPVLLIWIALRTRGVDRWREAGAFLAGVVISMLPILWLFLQSPHNVLFDIVGFHLFYRQVEWQGWQLHDLEVATAWLDCSQALILGALAIAGWLLVKRGDWPGDIRAEFSLCGWLALSMSAYLMTAHPTFQRYFLLVTPFAAILAAAGLYRISQGLRWSAGLVIVLTIMGLARSIYQDYKERDDSWYQIEPIAKKVDEVTPPGALLFADEPVYFLTRRMPPEGMEWSSGHKVSLPMPQAKPLHLLPRDELAKQVKAGKFATVETCSDSQPDALDLKKMYRRKAEVGECFIFWDKIPQ